MSIRDVLEVASFLNALGLAYGRSRSTVGSVALCCMHDSPPLESLSYVIVQSTFGQGDHLF